MTKNSKTDEGPCLKKIKTKTKLKTEFASIPCESSYIRSSKMHFIQPN